MRIIVDFIPTEKSSIAQNVVYGCVAYYTHLSHLTFSDRDSLQWKKWTSPDIPQDIIQHTPTLDHGFLCVQSCRNMELSWVMVVPLVIIIHFEGIFHYKPSIWGYSHLWEPPYLTIWFLVEDFRLGPRTGPTAVAPTRADEYSTCKQ